MVDLVRRRVLAHLQPIHLLLLVVPTPADAMRTAVHLRVDRARVPQPGLRRSVARAPVADRHEAVGIGSAERRKHQASTEHVHTELFLQLVKDLPASPSCRAVQLSSSRAPGLAPPGPRHRPPECRMRVETNAMVVDPRTWGVVPRRVVTADADGARSPSFESLFSHSPPGRGAFWCRQKGLCPRLARASTLWRLATTRASQDATRG